MEAIEYEEIRQLLARYNTAIDLGDAAGWAACFTPDGVFECSGLPEGSPFAGRYAGTEVLRDYATMHHAISKGRARHWNANMLVEGDGETATMLCYLLALSSGSRIAGSTGIYRDELRKVDGQWRFAARHITMDAPPG